MTDSKIDAIKTDAMKSSAEALRYPWENHPGPDQVVEIKRARNPSQRAKSIVDQVTRED